MACRGFAAALSAWLEEQSGLSLLTPEGECALLADGFTACVLQLFTAWTPIGNSTQVTRVSLAMSWAECTGDAGTLPLQRPAPASSSLAWETLSNRDHQRRPGHAVTEAASIDTADAETRQSSRYAGSVDSSDGTSGIVQSTLIEVP